MPRTGLNEDAIPAALWAPAVMPLLLEGHQLRIPLSGMSMYPFIVGGRDEVLLTSVSKKKPKRGDIVLYARSTGKHVLHRIHHIRSEGFYMLGDSSSEIEGPISPKDVLAVTETIIRKGKQIHCRNLVYRIISEIWLLLRLLRPMIIKIANKLLHR